MSNESKTLMIFGAGKLGGPLIDLMAMRYPNHRYVLVARSPEIAERRLNLVRYVVSQWGLYPELHWVTTDLLDVDRTAEQIQKYQPDVIFNAATPFAWWNVNSLPSNLSRLANEAGHGVWGALDCVPPMKLAEALSEADAHPIYVNGSYPDMVNAFLWALPHAPVVGIGNISNVVPGLRLAYARLLKVNPNDTRIQLVCHHFTSLNGPTIGGSGGAPYHLVVSTKDDRVVYKNIEDAPFALVKSSVPRLRGLEGQGVTVSSAATVLAAMMNGTESRHHTPGPLGLVGGYPITVNSDGIVALDLPSEIESSEAMGINEEAQKFDGVEAARPNSIRLTKSANAALEEIVGITLPEITYDNVLSYAKEIMQQLTIRYGFMRKL
jgi:hypothetical protein